MATANTKTPVPADESASETGTDVAVSPKTDPRAIIAALNSGVSTIFSTFTAETHADKVEILKALTDTVPLDDHLGEVINLANVVVQAVELTDNNGETVTAPRIILVDADGTAYACVSTGVLKSLENIFGILGQPSTWPGPLAIVVAEAKARSGFKFFTVKMV